MHIARIVVQNFGPFVGRHEIAFPQGTIGITGRNRSGKSTFVIDALLCALFGQSRYGSSMEHMVTVGHAHGSVLVDLSDGSTVKRSWKKGKGSVQFSGFEGANKRHVDRAIRDHVGLSAEDFLSLSLFAQGDAQRLAEASPTDRKRLVEKWITRPLWARAYESAKAERTVLANRLQSHTMALDRLRRDLESEKDAPEPLDLSPLEDEIQRARRKLTKLEAARPVEPSDLSRLHEEVGALRQDMERAKCNLKTFDGVCPIVQAECPVAADIADQTHARQVVYENARRAFAKAKSALSELRISWNEELEKWRKQKAAAERRLIEAKDEFQNVQIKSLRQQEQAKRQQTLRKQLRETQAQYKEDQAHLKVLTYVESMFGVHGIPAMELASALHDVEAIANEAVLAGIGVPYRVGFRHGKELKKWADSCPQCTTTNRSGDFCGECGSSWPKARSEALDILIVDGEQELVFDQESGACKSGTAMALRLAFAQQKGNLKVAVVDEGFDFFDRETKPALAAFIFGPRFAQLGFDQVFVCSHDAGILASADHVLEVERTSQGSVVKWRR